MHCLNQLVANADPKLDSPITVALCAVSPNIEKYIILPENTKMAKAYYIELVLENIVQ